MILQHDILLRSTWKESFDFIVVAANKPSKYLMVQIILTLLVY